MAVVHMGQVGGKAAALDKKQRGTPDTGRQRAPVGFNGGFYLGNRERLKEL